MEIYVKYNNNTKLIKTKYYQSINSILYDSLNEYKLNNNIENYYIDYNGNFLDGTNSLEKYEIKNKSILTLNIKQKGGNSFTSFAKANPAIVIIAFTISLAPILILPTGFIPTTSSLIKTIIEKSIASIGKYIVCNLGKVTLFSRIGFFLSIIKYVMFILMIYVLITFPLIIFCVTLKGHNVLDSPQSMCSPISKGSLVGLILTCIYILIYIGYRFGDYFIDFTINLFKKVYFLNTTFNPLLLLIKRNFNTIKYIPFFFVPFIGGITSLYFSFLNFFVIGLELVLSTVSDVGCKTKFDSISFGKMLTDKLKNLEEIKCESIRSCFKDDSVLFDKETIEKKNIEKKTTEKKTTEKNDIKIKTFKKTDENICIDDFKRCCNPDNFLLIGDAVVDILKNTFISDIIKAKGLYPAFILFNQALYEYGLSNAEISDNIPTQINDRERFLKNILNTHKDRLSDSTKDIIGQYLKTFNSDIYSKVKDSIDTDFRNDITTINKIKDRLDYLETIMTNFSIENHSRYIQGETLIKSMLKIFVMNSFCNVLETTKTGSNVMSKMGDVYDIVDMLKAGSVAGITVSFGYIVSLIVLLVMVLLHKF